MTTERTLNEDDYLPLGSLNDLLYCERRCALHRIEGVWTDNAATLDGTFSHQRADKPVTWESADGVREVHGMWLKSDRLRLVDKADVVEFREEETGAAETKNEERTMRNEQRNEPKRTESPILHSPLFVPRSSFPTVPYPVEYKRGKRRKWDNDDVQLCAQALCLEEMLGVAVPRGAIFHIKTKRRREVLFTDSLRRKTEAAAARLHDLIATGVTPPAVLKPQCDGCSLRQICLPELQSTTPLVKSYCEMLLRIQENEK